MFLKVLGTQSPYSTKGHHCIGYMLEEGNSRVMLDCGSGVHSQLYFPNVLDGLPIILTHLHRDHYSDISVFQYSSSVFKRLGRVTQPISVFLPSEPANIAQDIISEKEAFATYTFIDGNDELHIGDFVITFCKTDHPIPTYAVKVQSPTTIVVYTSDTSYSAKDRLAEFAHSADLIISDSSLLESYGYPEICNHMTAKQAAKLALKAGAKRLALSHFWPEENVNNYMREATKVFGNTFSLEEGRSYSI